MTEPYITGRNVGLICIAVILLGLACGCTSPFIKHMNSARASLRDAELALASGDDEKGKKLITEADEHIRRAAELGKDEPEFPAVIYMQGMLAALQGGQAEALRNFAEAVKLDPENPEFLARYGAQLCGIGETLVHEGKNAEGKKKIAEGRRNLEKAIKADPEFGGGYVLLAQACYVEEDIEGARKHLKTGVSLMLKGQDGEPPSIEEQAGIYSRLAELAERAGDAETAEKYRRLAYETDPTRKKYLAGYVRILGALGTREKLDKARRLLEDSIDADPNDGETADILGLVYEALRQDTEAMEMLGRARRLGVLSFDGHRALVRIYDRAGRREDAIGLLEGYLKALKKDGEIERTIIVAHALAQLIIAEPMSLARPGDIGKVDAITGSRALKALDSALEIAPRNLDLAHARAFVLLLMRRLPEAQKIADRILAEGGGQSFMGHTLYLPIHKLNGDTEKAIESAKSVIEADPTLIPFYMELVELLRDKPDEAIEILKQGLEKNPGEPDILGALTAIALESEDYAGANKYADMLIEKHPKYFLGYFYRASAALGTGDMKTADLAIEQARKHAPNAETRAQINAEWERKRTQRVVRQMRQKKYPDAEAFGKLELKEREAFVYRATIDPSPQGLDLLKLALKDPDTYLRAQAVQGIAFYNASDAVPLLRAALDDGNEKVRAIAAHVSVKIEFDGRLQRLAGLLEDGSAYVREVSAMVLRDLTGKRFGYDHKADADSRAAAVKRWKDYISSLDK